MNSVHEQCPISDSEIVLSQKLDKCTMCTATAQLAHPGAHRRAQAREHMAVSWVLWPCRGRVTGADGRVVGAPAPCRRRPSAVSQALCRAPGKPCRDTAQALPIPLGHNTLRCIDTQFLQQPGCSCHDTIGVS